MPGLISVSPKDQNLAQYVNSLENNSSLDTSKDNKDSE